jgi:hypothetical protein
MEVGLLSLVDEGISDSVVGITAVVTAIAVALTTDVVAPVAGNVVMAVGVDTTSVVVIVVPIRPPVIVGMA